MAKSMHDPNLIHNKKKTGSTQDYLDIAGIREDVALLKNGNLRGVLAVSSINFSLKSSEEQDSIIYAYQSFLNSIDFPIQIVVNSRKFNIYEYLEKLKGLEQKQGNELLRVQTAEYRNYIESLIEIANIMSKTFYVVVPFSPVEMSGNATDKLKESAKTLKSKQVGEKKYSNAEFQRLKSQLQQRVSHVQSGLSGIGIRMVQLNTQELIELYYTLYNPEAVHEKKLADPSELDIHQQ